MIAVVVREEDKINFLSRRFRGSDNAIRVTAIKPGHPVINQKRLTCQVTKSVAWPPSTSQGLSRAFGHPPMRCRRHQN